MKSEHRHELKTNELAEWLANFPQWAKDNLKMIIFVSILVVGVVGGYIYLRYQKNVVSVRKQLELTRMILRLPIAKLQILQGQTEEKDLSFILLQPAGTLQAISDNTKNNDMAALALIKRGEALRTELHYRLGVLSARDLESQINQAKASYTEAVRRATSNWSLTALAKFGLGLCEEELGNFEGAQEIYREITADARFEASTSAFAAKQRLETMADYQQKIVFKQPAILPPAAIKPPRPRIKLSPADIKLEPAKEPITGQ